MCYLVIFEYKPKNPILASLSFKIYFRVFDSYDSRSVPAGKWIEERLRVSLSEYYLVVSTDDLLLNLMMLVMGVFSF